MTREEELRQSIAHRRLLGKAELLYVLRGEHGAIDVGPQLLDAMKRLAAWWGVPIETRALGYGGYRVARPRAAQAPEKGAAPWKDATIGGEEMAAG